MNNYVSNRVISFGNGSNLQAIIDAIANGKCPVQIAAVISDNPEAYALTRAREAHIPTHALPRGHVNGRGTYLGIRHH